MKRIIAISTCLSIAALVGLNAPTVNAGEMAATWDTARTRVVKEIEPFNLVYTAYQGGYSENGIPSYDGLSAAYDSGDITAEDLMEVAISEGRLSASKLDDPSYVNAVKAHLEHLEGR